MITPALLREWNACWDDDRITAHFGGRTELTPREIAADESISLEDRLWVLCQSLGYLDEDAARGYAVESALSIAHLAGDEDDQSQYLAILNRILEIEDPPIEERSAAMSAAMSTAMSAAWDAARDAAWDAALSATRDAARDAAWYAAWYAARPPIKDARDAGLRKAIARALKWLGDYADGWEP